MEDNRRRRRKSCCSSWVGVWCTTFRGLVTMLVLIFVVYRIPHTTHHSSSLFVTKSVRKWKFLTCVCNHVGFLTTGYLRRTTSMLTCPRAWYSTKYGRHWIVGITQNEIHATRLLARSLLNRRDPRPKKTSLSKDSTRETKVISKVQPLGSRKDDLRGCAW